MTRLITAVFLLAILGVAGCGGGSYGGNTAPPPPNGRTILATPSLTFGPASLSVSAGDAVTFSFGSVAHNVFFDARAGAPADISGLNANVDVTRVFTTPGTYHYTCHIHPSMQGTVVVN